jgi:hypothetical protein
MGNLMTKPQVTAFSMDFTFPTIQRNVKWKEVVVIIAGANPYPSP